MIIELDRLFFETALGTWRSKYIGEPNGLHNSDRVDYYIRFKWIDPNNPENKITPERRLRLVIYHKQSERSDYEMKLIRAIQTWLDSDEGLEAAYVYPSVLLQSSIN